jgi:O-6-methylguanine DNA methyltransferase
MTTICHTTCSTPLGEVFIAASADGLVAATLPDTDWPGRLDDLRRRFPGATLREDAAALAPFTVALDRWLDGEDFPLDLPVVLDGTPFQRAAWQVLREIPRGQVITYGELATRAGKPGAARAAGSACGANRIPLFVPCHRVVAASGLGGFGGGLTLKRVLLAMEGVRSPGERSSDDSEPC